MFLFQLSYPSYWIIVSVFTSLLLSYILYVDRNSYMIKNNYVTTFFLRFLSLFFIGILLLKPVSKTLKTEKNIPIFLIFSDASKSVQNYHIEREIKKFISKYEKRLNIKNFHFSDKVYDGFPKKYDGKRTNLNSVFEYVNKNFINQNLVGSLIITDGIINDGRNPVNDIQSGIAPFFVVGIGDTTKKTDIRIENINFNPISIVNSEVTVELEVFSENIEKQPFRSSVMLNDDIVETLDFHVERKTYYKKITHKLKLDEVGVQKITFKISELENEKNVSNNKKEISIDVIESKYNILLLYGDVHPDANTIQKSLESDININLNIMHQSSLNLDVDDFDLVIFSGINKIEEFLINEINRAKKSVLLLSNNNKKLFKNFFSSINFDSNENFFDVQLSFEENFSKFQLNKDLIKQFESGPFLSTNFFQISGINKSDVIFYDKVDGLKNRIPLVISKSGSVNKAAFFVENIWRQRIYDFKINENHTKFDRFILDLCKSLIFKSKQNRIFVDYNKNLLLNSKLELKVKKYNNNYELINNKDLYFECLDKSNLLIKKKLRKYDNYYKLELDLINDGEYNFKIVGDSSLKLYESSFFVNEIDLEDELLYSNQKLLKKIAKVNDGKFSDKIQYDYFDNFFSENNMKNEFVTKLVKTEDIKNNQWILLILLIIIISEVLIRRTKGKK